MIGQYFETQFNWELSLPFDSLLPHHSFKAFLYCMHMTLVEQLEPYLPTLTTNNHLVNQLHNNNNNNNHSHSNTNYNIDLHSSIRRTKMSPTSATTTTATITVQQQQQQQQEQEQEQLESPSAPLPPPLLMINTLSNPANVIKKQKSLPSPASLDPINAFFSSSTSSSSSSIHAIPLPPSSSASSSISTSALTLGLNTLQMDQMDFQMDHIEAVVKHTATTDVVMDMMDLDHSTVHLCIHSHAITSVSSSSTTTTTTTTRGTTTSVMATSSSDTLSSSSSSSFMTVPTLVSSSLSSIHSATPLSSSSSSSSSASSASSDAVSTVSSLEHEEELFVESATTIAKGTERASIITATTTTATTSVSSEELIDLSHIQTPASASSSTYSSSSLYIEASATTPTDSHHHDCSSLPPTPPPLPPPPAPELTPLSPYDIPLTDENEHILDDLDLNDNSDTQNKYDDYQNQNQDSSDTRLHTHYPHLTDPDLPWHFSWIDDGMIGGSSAPFTRQHWRAFARHNVGLVVNLTEAPISSHTSLNFTSDPCDGCSFVHDLPDLDVHMDVKEEEDIQVLFLPIRDGSVPSFEQLKVFMKEARDTIVRRGKRVVVHCQAGEWHDILDLVYVFSPPYFLLTFPSLAALMIFLFSRRRSHWYLFGRLPPRKTPL
jgi:hypothetical protein